MTEKEFDANLVEALDNIVASMADNPDVDLEKFYSMTCVIENLRFFSPVFYAALIKGKKNKA